MRADPDSFSSQEQQRRVPQYDTAAIVKLVAVRVLDDTGRPVMGLAKDDFLLTDNGRKMTITEFEVHRLAAEGTAAAAVERPIPSEVRGGLNRKIFIFLDLQGSDEDGMANAKKAGFHFLDTQLQPDDEVGIIGFSPMRGFFIQEYLTRDHAKIREALKRTKELRPSRGSFEPIGPADSNPRAGRPAEARGGGETGAEISSGGGLARAADSPNSAARETSWIFVPGTSAYQRKDFVPRLSDLAEVMKRTPGNKSLVFFSGRDLGPAATMLGRSFADAGTPVYAINTKNWIMKGMFTKVKEKHIYEEHSLKDLSLTSGGEYFADIEDFQTIAREVQALSGNYYVLGYYVQESWDGKFHEIDVEVQKPGLRVLAQAGYFNPKPFAEMSEFEKELHLFGLIYSERPVDGEALDLPVAVLDVATQDGRDGVVLVEIAVDPKSGVSPSKVELFALIRDEDLTPVVSRKWDLDLSTYNGETVIMCFSTPLDPGVFDGRIVVRDVETGRSAVGRAAFEIEPSSEKELVLSSPVILVPGADTKIGNLPLGRTRRGRPAERNLIDHYPFIPRNHRIVVRDLNFGTGRILAVVPGRLKASVPGSPLKADIWARLVSQTGGEEILLDLKVIDGKSSKDGHEFLIVEITLPALDRGEYELVIAAEDLDTGKSGSVRTALVIK